MTAFLSYSRQERDSVKSIATALQARGVEVWLDEWSLRPGMPWQAPAEAGLRECQATVVFVGPGGLGQWQEAEVRAALDEHRRRNIAVVPVLLPGTASSKADELIPVFLRQYTWILFADSVDDPEALNRLIWGITGINPFEAKSRPPPQPTELASAPAVPGDSLSNAARRVASKLRTTNLTLFVGRHVHAAGDGVDDGPPDMTRYLLQALEVLEGDSGQIVLPADVAAAYFAVGRSEPDLAAEVRNWVLLWSARIPPLYGGLTTLLRALTGRPRERGIEWPLQLIVTTNFDVLLERSLLRAGLSFTRLVQHRDKARIEVNEYRNVSLEDGRQVVIDAADGKVSRAGIDDAEALNEVIRHAGHRTVALKGDLREAGAANPLKALDLTACREPILYKFLGSVDWPDSCTISSDQYFEFASRILRQDCVPVHIDDALANTPMLFLGCRILDPDFRLAYHVLLKEHLLEKNNEHQHFLVRTFSTDFEDRVQRARWEDIKRTALARYRVEVLECEPVGFLDALHAALPRRVGGGA